MRQVARWQITSTKAVRWHCDMSHQGRSRDGRSHTQRQMDAEARLGLGSGQKLLWFTCDCVNSRQFKTLHALGIHHGKVHRATALADDYGFYAIVQDGNENKCIPITRQGHRKQEANGAVGGQHDVAAAASTEQEANGAAGGQHDVAAAASAEQEANGAAGGQRKRQLEDAWHGVMHAKDRCSGLQAWKTLNGEMPNLVNSIRQQCEQSTEAGQRISGADLQDRRNMPSPQETAFLRLGPQMPEQTCNAWLSMLNERKFCVGHELRWRQARAVKRFMDRAATRFGHLAVQRKQFKPSNVICSPLVPECASQLTMVTTDRGSPCGQGIARAVLFGSS